MSNPLGEYIKLHWVLRSKRKTHWVFAIDVPKCIGLYDKYKKYIGFCDRNTNIIGFCDKIHKSIGFAICVPKCIGLWDNNNPFLSQSTIHFD